MGVFLFDICIYLHVSYVYKVHILGFSCTFRKGYKHIQALDDVQMDGLRDIYIFLCGETVAKSF